MVHKLVIYYQLVTDNISQLELFKCDSTQKFNLEPIVNRLEKYVIFFRFTEWALSEPKLHPNFNNRKIGKLNLNYDQFL